MVKEGNRPAGMLAEVGWWGGGVRVWMGLAIGSFLLSGVRQPANLSACL